MPDNTYLNKLGRLFEDSPRKNVVEQLAKLRELAHVPETFEATAEMVRQAKCRYNMPPDLERVNGAVSIFESLVTLAAMVDANIDESCRKLSFFSTLDHAASLLVQSLRENSRQS